MKGRKVRRAERTSETVSGRMSGRKNSPTKKNNPKKGPADTGSRRRKALLRSIRRSAHYLRQLAEGTTAAEIERRDGVPPRTLNSVRQRAARALSAIGLTTVSARNAPLLARLLFREVFDLPEDLAFRQEIADLLLKTPDELEALVDEESDET